MKYNKEEAINLIGGTEEDYQDFRGMDKEQVAAKMREMFSGEADETLAEEIAIFANEGFDAMAEENGSIQHEGQELALTQIAYADNDMDLGVVYKANAVDRDGNEYEILWNTTVDFDLSGEYNDLISRHDLSKDDENRLSELIDMGTFVDCSDESNACDWDSPVSVTKLNL